MICRHPPAPSHTTFRTPHARTSSLPGWLRPGHWPGPAAGLAAGTSPDADPGACVRAIRHRTGRTGTSRRPRPAAVGNRRTGRGGVAAGLPRCQPAEKRRGCAALFCLPGQVAAGRPRHPGSAGHQYTPHQAGRGLCRGAGFQLCRRDRAPGHARPGHAGRIRPPPAHRAERPCAAQQWPLAAGLACARRVRSERWLQAARRELRAPAGF